ncbi:hypothetical protein [Actinomadura algeriensis]|uniref:Uncharacterized protein n=1 Tax=Actinomadura algeriensis TaxID=1679523 RepID=A0ABR9JR66_9ACTN|nr:hypothetical protein [Actinomadura algeriensis]MBE1533063.1 hypothetical protein [Actinomadura algeriensis]
MPEVDAAAPYTVRMWPVLQLLLLLLMLVLPAVFGIGMADESANPWPFLVMLLGEAAVFAVLAGVQLRRMWRSRWIALRLDARGVHMAGRPWSTVPQFVPWQDVAEIVVFGTLTQPRVGIRVKDGVPGAFAPMYRRLEDGLRHASLDPALGDRVRDLVDRVRASAEGPAVTVYTEGGSHNGWRPDWKSIERAAAAWAPSVEVTVSGNVGDPAGWLSRRDQMEKLAAELG